jgi:signal peptide peptidase SppA
MQESTLKIGPDAMQYVHQYLGYWAMREEELLASFGRISRIELDLHVRDNHEARVPDKSSAKPSTYDYEVRDGVAILDIRGTLMKAESSLGSSTSTVKMRRTLRAAMADEQVKGLLLCFESPGGSVAGTQELADDIYEAAQQKPCVAFVEDLCASAAYWLASQTDEILGNATALVGSIGTYATIYDYSGAAAKDGVRVNVIRAGKYKGAGTPGTEITAEQIANWQREVDALNAQFLATVGRGRQMPLDKVAELNDGRVHVGEDAKKMGLIDAVGTKAVAESRVRQLISMAPSSSNRRAQSNESTMSQPVKIKVTEGNKITTFQANSVEELGEVMKLHTAEPGGATTDLTAAATAAGDSGASAPTAATGAEATARKETEMSQTNSAAPGANPAAAPPASPVPATAAEIRAACPGASSDFVLEQLEKSATMTQVAGAFIQFQAAQIRARDEELAKSKQQSQPPRKTGVDPLRTSAANPTPTVGAGSDFESLVAAKVKAGMPRDKAIAAAVRENPEAHMEFLRQSNPARNVRVEQRQTAGGRTVSTLTAD